MTDRDLFRLYERHQRLLGEVLRSACGGVDFKVGAVKAELSLVHEAILEELGKRGYLKEPVQPEQAYDDPNGSFHKLYDLLSTKYKAKTLT